MFMLQMGVPSSLYMFMYKELIYMGLMGVPSSLYMFMLRES
jgi:hypothetical protein